MVDFVYMSWLRHAYFLLVLLRGVYTRGLIVFIAETLKGVRNPIKDTRLARGDIESFHYIRCKLV